MTRGSFAFLALLMGLATNAAANVVVNPSFETFTGSFNPDGAAGLAPGATSLTGWRIVDGDGGIIKTGNIYNLTPSDGDKFLDLTGYSNAGFPKGVSQTLTGLTVGQIYALSLDIGIRNGPCVNGGDNCHGPVEVKASIGSTSETFTENSALSGNNWGTFGFDFKATDTSMDLVILGLSVPLGNEYIGVDRVSVNAIPEPAAVWMVGLGVVVLLAVGKLHSRRW